MRPAHHGLNALVTRDSLTTPWAYYTRRFLCNLSFGILAKIVQAGVALFLISYLVWRLGPEQFGLVIVATTVASFLSLIQMGASTGLAKHLTSLQAQSQAEGFQCYFNAAAWLAMGMAILVVLCLILLLTVFWSVLHIPASLLNESRWVVGFVGVGTVFSCLSLPALAALHAQHRIDLVAKVTLTGMLLRAVWTVGIFELAGSRPVYYGLILLAEQGLVFIGVWICYLRQSPTAQLTFRVPSISVLQRILVFNAFNLFSSLNYVLLMQAPVFVLQRIGGLSSSGLYGVGLQLNNIMRSFLGAIMTAMAPIAFTMESEGTNGPLAEAFRISTKLFAALGGLMWVWFYFFGPAFLLIWLHRDIAPLTEALPSIMAAAAMGVAAMPASVAAVALGRLRLPAISGFLLAASMVSFMLFCGRSDIVDPLPRIAWLLALFFGTYQMVRVLDIAWALRVGSAKFVSLVFRSLLPALACVLVVLAVKLFIPGGTLMNLILGTVLMVGIAGIFLWKFLFTTAEYIHLRKVIDGLKSNSSQALT